MLFRSYNARQTSNATRRAPVGEIVSVIDNYINLSGRDIQGYELGLQWRSPRTRLGSFTLSGDATHYLLREAQADPVTPVLDELGRNGRAHWRGNASLSWREGAWSAGWFTSYFGTFVDTSAATTEAIYLALGKPKYISVFNDNGVVRFLYKVTPAVNHNAWIAYRFEGGAAKWLRGVSLRGGLNNVFDAIPPLADEQYGFFTGMANPRGRTFTFEVAKKF